MKESIRMMKSSDELGEKIGLKKKLTSVKCLKSVLKHLLKTVLTTY